MSLPVFLIVLGLALAFLLNYALGVLLILIGVVLLFVPVGRRQV